MKRRELLGPFIQAAIRAGAEIWDCTLIADHAIAVRRLERIKTAMRSGLAGDCPFYEEGGVEDPLDAGEPPCYRKPPSADEPCPECRLKLAELEHVRPRLANARRRLRAAIDRRMIPEPIRGFRGWRYRWWDRAEEIDFPDWMTP